MTDRLASCNCGKLTVATRGEPVRVSVCHCLNCKRRSGSAFAVQARFPVDAVSIDGESKEYALTGDEGGTATFHFCPACGATVYYLFDAVPGVISVPVGAFADPSFPAPRVSVYEERRHAWVQLTGDIERFD